MATKPKKQRRSSPKRKGFSTIHILAIVGAAVLVVALLVVLNTSRLGTVQVSELSYPTGVTPEGEPYKGAPDAPLQLVEYSDFLCSHCASFADTLSALGPDYLETGKLHVVFRNFAFLTPQSIQAAQASECALDQGADKFWHYHDLLFANQGRGLEAYSLPSLQRYAQQAGLDEGTFDTCLQSGAKAAEVQSDLDEGQSQGVEGTPTWFLNGQVTSGELPESELRELLERTLAEGS
jgi:protein-disulfide isomerase